VVKDAGGGRQVLREHRQGFLDLLGDRPEARTASSRSGKTSIASSSSGLELGPEDAAVAASNGLAPAPKTGRLPHANPRHPRILGLVRSGLLRATTATHNALVAPSLSAVSEPTARIATQSAANNI
jgi:hypothetical protein